MNVIDSFRLNGKTVIVTGGAGRYGKQITLALAEAGAIVFIASRDLEKNEKAAAEFRAQGGDVRALQLDLGSEESCDALVAEVVRQTGRIDVLVNNSVLRAHTLTSSGDLLLRSITISP